MAVVDLRQHSLALVGCCGPTLAVVGLRGLRWHAWPALAVVGPCWPSLACMAVGGLCWPSLAVVGLRWPSLASSGRVW